MRHLCRELLLPPKYEWSRPPADVNHNKNSLIPALWWRVVGNFVGPNDADLQMSRCSKKRGAVFLKNEWIVRPEKWCEQRMRAVRILGNRRTGNIRKPFRPSRTVLLQHLHVMSISWELFLKAAKTASDASIANDP
jgi:hypothetical protein